MIYAREKVVLFGLESSYGTDPAPGASAGVLAKNFTLSPMQGEDTARELDTPWMGDSGTIPTGVHRKLSFAVELAASGTAGVAPAWGPMLRACGVAETIVADTSVTYNSVTNGHESGAFYFFNGATLYKLLGSRGNAVLEFPSGGVPTIQFDMTGLYSPAAQGTAPTPTNLAEFRSATEFGDANSQPLALNGTDLGTGRVRFDLGNTVEHRPVTGAESVVISSKSGMIEATVDAVPLSTFDPFALVTSMADVALSLQHGSGAGNVMSLAATKAQMMLPGDLQADKNVTQWPLRLKPRPNAGNDQWTLTLT